MTLPTVTSPYRTRATADSNAARLAAELEALASIYGDDVICTSTEACLRLRTRSGGLVELILTFPPGYPADCAPALALRPGRDAPPRHVMDAIAERLRASVAREFCGTELGMQLFQLAAEEMDALVEEAGVPPPPPPPSGGDVTILTIDHMRKPFLYIKTLSELAARHRVLCKLLLPCAPAADALVKHVTLVVAGEDAAPFLTAARTEKVDVDSRGRRCVERLSRVLACVRLGREAWATLCAQPCWQGEAFEVEVRAGEAIDALCARLAIPLS